MDQRLKRRMRNAAQNSLSSASTIVTPGPHPLEIVFTAVNLTDNLTLISKRGVCTFFENLSLSKIKEAHFNSLRNVISADAINPLDMEALLLITSIGRVSLPHYIPCRSIPLWV